MLHTLWLEKCILTCTHHDSILQNRFTVLKILCSTYSFLLPHQTTVFTEVSIISGVSQWPEKYFLKCLAPEREDKTKYCFSIPWKQLYLAHGDWNNTNQPLEVWPLSDYKRQSSVRTHSLDIWKTRSFLPTLAPANHTRTMGSHPHCCLPQVWRMVVAIMWKAETHRNLPVFSPSISWMLQIF